MKALYDTKQHGSVTEPWGTKFFFTILSTINHPFRVFIPQLVLVTVVNWQPLPQSSTDQERTTVCCTRVKCRQLMKSMFRQLQLPPEVDRTALCQPHSTWQSQHSHTTTVNVYLTNHNARGQQLCATASQTCVVTQTYSTFGDTAFAAAGPRLWNSLPSHMEEADLSYNRYRWSLRTYVWIVGPRRRVNYFNCVV